MSRDFTLFEFDVDEATVRRLLSAIPGVTPLPPEGEESPADRPDDQGADGADAPTGDRPPSRDAAATADEAGVSGADSVSTPWPGAPGVGDDQEEDTGLLGRLASKRVLLAVALVLGLGVVGVAAVWAMNRRGADGPVADSVGDDFRVGATDGDSAGDRATADDGPRADDADGNGDSTTDRDERSYPIDKRPLVGMAFLAGVTVLLRRVLSREGADE